MRSIAASLALGTLVSTAAAQVEVTTEYGTETHVTTYPVTVTTITDCETIVYPPPPPPPTDYPEYPEYPEDDYPVEPYDNVICKTTTSTVWGTSTEVTTVPTKTATSTFKVTVCPEPTGRYERRQKNSNRLWGCEPGLVCNPPKPDDCNLWPGLPHRDFVCEPQDCIKAPPISKVIWEKGKTGYFPPREGYFPLNPHAFGLSYDIFEYDVIVKEHYGHTTTITTGNWESQASLTQWPPATTSKPEIPYKEYLERDLHMFAKRAVAAADCYVECEWAATILQSAGDDDRICEDGFYVEAYEQCQDCVALEEDPETVPDTIRDILGEDAERIYNLCSGGEDPITTTTSTSPDPAEPSQSLTTRSQDEGTTPTFSAITTTTTTTITSTDTTETTTSSSISSVPDDPITEPTTTITSTTTQETTITTSSTTEITATDSETTSTESTTEETSTEETSTEQTTTAEETATETEASTTEVETDIETTTEVETATTTEIVEPTTETKPPPATVTGNEPPEVTAGASRVLSSSAFAASLITVFAVLFS